MLTARVVFLDRQLTASGILEACAKMKDLYVALHFADFAFENYFLACDADPADASLMRNLYTSGKSL